MNKKNFFAHLHTVLTHRKWVRRYCFKAGLYWQGLVHDLSKYNPIEFFESVKYYQGDSSPIVACKAAKGYSKAWYHHRAKNKHHREFWADNFDKGTSSFPMPYKYAAEMLCDFLAAGRAYSGIAFTYTEELNWWKKQLDKNICIHPMTAKFIDIVLTELACFRYKYDEEEKSILKNLPFFFQKAEEWNRLNEFNKTYYGRSLDFKDKL